MSNIGNVGVEELHRYITKVAQKELNNSHIFDTVITGTIKESLPGYYVVSLTNGGDSSTVNALPMSSTDTWEKDDYVYLIKAPIASGDNHRVKYYIFGLVSDTQETFANATEWERFQAEGSSQSLDTIDFADHITSMENKEAQIKIINDSTFILDVINLGAFALNGSFTFDKNKKDSGNSISNYGLRIKLLNTNGEICKLSTGELAIFNLDTIYFTGQPFDMTSMSQKRVVTLEENINFTQIAIYVFVEGNLTMPLAANYITVNNISIQAGSLLNIAGRFSVQVAALSGYKDYFRSGTEETEGTDLIGLKATAYYDSQPLSADSIQYYWLIEDKSITVESEQYLSLAGIGWRCINNYNYAQVIDSNGDIITSNIRVWNNKHTSMIVDEVISKVIDNAGVEFGSIDIGLFNQYETKIKCIAKYQSAIVESEEHIIKNYDKHNFKASLKNKSDNNRLFFPEDQIVLICEANDDNSFASSIYTKTYVWSIQAQLAERENLYIDITPELLANGSQYVNEIHIKDDEKEEVHNDSGDILPYYYEFEIPNKVTLQENELEDPVDYTIKNILIKAIVRIDMEGTMTSAIELETDEIAIESMTSLAEEIKSIYIYKYYVSPSMNVVFRQSADDNGDWNGDWTVYDINDSSIANAWTELAENGQVVEDDAVASDARKAYNTLMKKNRFEIEPDNKYKNGAAAKSGDTPYIYYTKKELLYIYKGKQRGLLIEERNWSFPIVLRQGIVEAVSENTLYLKDRDAKSSTEIDQINTFNQLTQNGKENGIFYQEETYFLTEDEIPQSNKTYYTKSANNEYIEYKGETFSPNVSYYEKSTDGNKLYINATYINTGALRVGDKNNERFYASVDNEEVRIAGFNVDSSSISSGIQGNDDYVYLGENGLQVGNFLSVSKHGATFTGSISTAQLKEEVSLGTVIQYGLSDSKTEPPDVWEDSAPDWTAGKHMWQKLVTTFSNGRVEESVACIEGAKGEQGESNIILEIGSSSGNSFINQEGDTVLYVRAIKDNQDITSTFLEEQFVWERYDHLGNLDIYWSETGTILHISGDEIFKKAVYNCTLTFEKKEA